MDEAFEGAVIRSERSVQVSNTLAEKGQLTLVRLGAVDFLGVGIHNFGLGATPVSFKPKQTPGFASCSCRDALCLSRSS